MQQVNFRLPSGSRPTAAAGKQAGQVCVDGSAERVPGNDPTTGRSPMPASCYTNLRNSFTFMCCPYLPKYIYSESIAPHACLNTEASCDSRRHGIISTWPAQRPPREINYIHAHIPMSYRVGGEPEAFTSGQVSRGRRLFVVVSILLVFTRLCVCARSFLRASLTDRIAVPKPT